MRNDNFKRLKRAYISPEVLMDAMSGGNWWRFSKGQLPADSEFLSVCTDFPSNGVMMLVRSSEFEKVGEGCEIPNCKQMEVTTKKFKGDEDA